MRQRYGLALRQLAQPCHLAPLLLRRVLAATPAPAVDFTCVYRRRNQAHVNRVVAQLPPGARVALWALDGPVPALAAHTVGTGPGLRLELLNRLVAALPAEDRWLVVSDDDVSMPAGQLGVWLRAAVYAGLDLSQPAHLPRSHASWRVNRQRLGDYVRLGRWVETGPLVAFSPAGRRMCVPLPEALGMGLGVEVVWAGYAERGLRLGIVDAVGMRHLHPISTEYDPDVQGAASVAALTAQGYAGLGRSWGQALDAMAQLQDERGKWRLWRRTPPWAA